MKRHHQKQKNSVFATVASVLSFVLVLAVLVVGVLNFSAGAGDEGVEATRRAIERAAVLCYATEGFYPPGLAYIEQHYGVQVDQSRYAVRYEVYAANVKPVIQVVPRGSS